jgi:hypothetical protein
MRRRASLLALALVLGPAAVARAFDFRLGGQPLRLDLTESMYLAAHLDDGTPDPTTKNYGELLNRVNAQLAWNRFLFSVRFDSGAWVHTPGEGDHSPYVSPPGAVPPLDCPAAAANNQACVVQPHDSRIFRPDPNQPGNYLPYRFRGLRDTAGNVLTVERGPVPLGVAAFYLEKIAFSYVGRDVEATLGDFYVNLGRGLVLSIRKIDELGVDTTITGGKVVVHHGDLGAIAFAGVTNVQNIDTTDAHWIPDPNDFVSALHVDYRFFDRVLVGAHGVFGKSACAADIICPSHPFSYAYHLRPGVMLDAPRLTRWLGIYLEYARNEDRVNGQDPPHDVTSMRHNHALYGAANVYVGRTTWLLEFKWYDNYKPWYAADNAPNNNPFGNLVYTAPPTLERLTTQINNNTDITAARMRVDVRVSRSLLLYYSTEFGTSHPGPLTTDMLIDLYGGAELRWNEGRSHFFPLVGYRDEFQESNPDPKVNVNGEVEERLIALEWDAAQVLPRNFSLETSGLVWFRRKIGIDQPWREGNVYVSLRWSPRLVLSGGYEFTTDAQQANNTHNFFNGSLLWNITSATSITLFVGGNRPGLKCISGVCRVFPAFEGARIEFVLRL